MKNPSEASTGNTLIVESTASPGEGDKPGYFSSLALKPQDRYKFIRSIGFGGMKGVLLVHDRDTDREMAMAIMPDFRERSASELERFAREAYLTARLEHPNIVPVYDIGIDESGSPFFTMKYLRGVSLETLLRRLKKGDTPENREFPLTRLLLIYTRICNAVWFAHSKGVCHLDLKPANIRIGDYGETFVLDWGLACQLDENGSITQELDGMRGTPGYMAPEQFDLRSGFSPGVRSDVFSLGVILYSILALASPFDKGPVEEIARQTVSGRIPKPSEKAPDFWYVPPALEAVALKAMSPHPLDRYADVKALRDDIMAFSGGYATKAERASTIKKSRLFINRHSLLVVILILLALLAWQLADIFF